MGSPPGNAQRRSRVNCISVRATMHSIEQPTLEDSCSSKKHASYHITRSVPGMKSLLPLRLLSPSLPEINACPSLALNNRSMFGMSIVSNDEEDSERPPKQLENEQNLRAKLGSHRSKLYRDIPIYTEPGSPLLSRAYLTDDELHSNCTTSESDEWFEVNECAGVGIEGAFGCVGGSCRTKGCMDSQGVEPENTLGLAEEHLPPINRSSGLSFQCSGEPQPLFSDEAAWLRSPLSYDPLKKPFKMPPDLPFERSVKSWLSDTSSCGDDNFLSRATALAPAKAHVVDVNVNRPSGLSIQVPPRSSSLAGTTVIHVPAGDNRDSWIYSSCSPPATPSQPWTGVRNPSPKQNLFRRQFDPYLPKRRLDLAMTSPPLSPTTETADALNIPSVWKELSTTCPDEKEFGGDSTSDTEQAVLSTDSINDILTALENLTSHFPSTTLQPDTPCILAIRSQLAPPSTVNQQSKPSNGLHPPLFLGHPSADVIVRRRKTTNFSKPRRSPSTATSKSCPAPRSTQLATVQDFHLPHSTHQVTLPPPDMHALHRIFPKSSKFMCSSLYANILAHIFVTSLSTPHKLPRSLKKRRDTPYWPTTGVPSKAADVLGIPGLGIAYPQAPKEDGVRSEQVSRLVEVLRKSITCLISSIDSESYPEDSELTGLKAELGSLFIKSLEEVVRSCEMSSYHSF